MSGRGGAGGRGTARGPARPSGDRRPRRTLRAAWRGAAQRPERRRPLIREHLRAHVPDDPSALVFAGPNGGVLRRGNFRRAARWPLAVETLGLPNLHFHDLRHTGNTLAAQSGASLRDLMDRMGHDSVRAAMIYQHATSEAGRAIADALNDKINAERGGDDDEDDGGLGGVLVPVA
ncbi:tyrosine-type recombinase/integrase [Actinomadura sp. DSM 109109]|nr:tyrosine-type recombinase/integrase [Actinomadura lepetitiana]